MAGNGSGEIGDLNSKGYIIDMNKKGDRYMYTDKMPPTSEHRFNAGNALPTICSKYKKSDRSFDLAKMSQRNLNYMIKDTAFGNNLATADQGLKKQIKGQV